MGRPRQIYITKSPLLAEKVEEDYVELWLSLGTSSDIPEYVIEHIRRWNSRKKINPFVADSAVGNRDDLPKNTASSRRTISRSSSRWMGLVQPFQKVIRT